MQSRNWRGVCLALAAIAAVMLPAQVQADGVGDAIRATMGNINAALETQGADYRLEVVEFLGPEDFMGQTVFFNHRGNKQLGHHFVPGDSRRGWGDVGGTGITYINDLFDGATTSGLTPGQTDGAIQAATATWQNQQCSNIPLINFGSFNFDFGFVQFLLGFGGSPFVFADITHGGWLGGPFFDAIVPGGSSFILGVTFTFTFTGGDTNGDGKADTAIREIYYNDAFPWALGSTFDVETVALHELGHGLSQAHFGKAFRTLANGKLHFAPRDVMNAAYSGVQTTINGSDNAGHCSIWGSWPN